MLLTGCQYVRQSRHNRTRIRTPQGAQWLTIPVQKGQLGLSIAETQVSRAQDWWRNHRKALRYNYGSSPFYSHYAPAIEALTWSGETPLSGITTACIQLMAGWLGSAAPISEDARVPQPSPRQVSLTVEGGDCFGVLLNQPVYRQAFEGFVPGLSCLDLIMNYGPRARELLLEWSRLAEVPSPETNPVSDRHRTR